MSDGRKTWMVAAGAFAVGLAIFGYLCHRLPALPDPDSYYHLAIGRLYADHGLMDRLPWARMSVLTEGFGDKEVLFHLLLAPFADAFGAAGGRWALALLNALVLAALAAFSVRAAGPWGLAVPLLVYLGSADFDLRVVRLRPELLSLAGFLAAWWCAAHGRYRLLGVVAFAYTLAYTAFHALAGLCLAWFLHQGWVRRRWSWLLLAYPLAGAGVGLVVHPHFPHNLLVWKIQTVDFFLEKGELNVGTEIEPQSADQLLLGNLVVVLGLLALWRAADRGRHHPGDDDERMADFSLVAAGLFAGLYFLALRFAVYAVPFAALAVVWALRRRGAGIGRWTVLPGRGRIPLALVLSLVLWAGVWRTARLLAPLYAEQEPVPHEVDWAAFGQAMPVGARVAAEWGSTHLYMYWAPQASYLNVLDPVFMAAAHPRRYRVLREVFEGREPDLPRAVHGDLESDYLALSHFHPERKLLRRFEADPRIEALYSGLTRLYRLVPGANGDFVLDWRVVPRETTLPIGPDADVAAWPVWPRSRDPALFAREGFVDADRVDPESECLGLVHELEGDGTRRLYELAPYGPTTLWVDERLAVSVNDVQQAHLGRGVGFTAELGAGRRRLSVLTCRVPPQAPGSPSYSGFYLRRRDRHR